MVRSYEKINYALRPAKNVERKMLSEALHRLLEFGLVDAYRYIGFGSTSFGDFRLFHRLLGITEMISIEKDEESDSRFEFNRPYDCINIIFKESNDALPELPWDVRTILWLDYDGKLNRSVLTDVGFFCSSALQGSVLVVTVNAQPDELDSNRMESLAERVGRENVPPDLKENEMAGWGPASVSRRIITNKIEEKLNERNGGLPPGGRMLYKQLFYFQYQDGAKMATVGGLIYDEGQTGHLGKCQFEKLPFVRTGDEPFLIEIPSLTYKEMRHLNSQLPTGNYIALKAEKIPVEDLRKYHQLYRHFPAFVEAEM